MIIGGFLGAGKTTSILSIAKDMLSEGKRIGIITNDQGSISADTEFLKHQGLQVLEINGGCLCSNLDQLEEKIKAIQNNDKLDIIFVEPVGCCTDIVATIMKPIKESKNGWREYHILPLSVILDPIILKEVIQKKDKNIPKEIEYLIQKQLEEADVIVLNKIDYLCKADVSELSEYITEKYPKKKMVLISASQNIGIQEWIYEIFQMNLNSELYENQYIDINYDQYMKAEKEIGWLNLSCEFTVKEQISAVILITSLADKIKDMVKKSNNEIAHLKIFFYNNDASCQLNSIGVSSENVIDHRLKKSIKYGNLIINIRAYIKPDQLKNIAHSALNDTFYEVDGTLNNLQMECFSPIKAKPVYRYL